MLLISAQEPVSLRALGTVSSEPEKWGVDFLFATPHGLTGIQRKEVKDLVASIQNGDRICRELGQSRDLAQVVLLVEGDFRWMRDGTSRVIPGFLRSQWDGLLLSLQSEGWWVIFSESLADTPAVIARTRSWFEKAKHGSLRQRPKSRGMWGTASNKEWGIYWWQSYTGIGIGLATILYEAFGVPAVWTVTYAELIKVPGIGPKRAREILGALTPVGGSNGEEGVSDEDTPGR